MSVIQKSSVNAHNLHTELPFYNLNNAEFNSLFNCDYRCVDSNIDLRNQLSNPDKLDESDPDHMLDNISSDYYPSEKVDTSGPRLLSLFHCNIRSLSRNLNITYSLSVKPDILAVTETKLNSNTVTNINMPGYNFYHFDSMTSAGGAGIYVCKNLEVIDRPDIKLPLS